METKLLWVLQEEKVVQYRLGKSHFSQFFCVAKWKCKEHSIHESASSILLNCEVNHHHAHVFNTPKSVSVNRDDPVTQRR